MTTEKKPSEWATLMASALAVNHVCYHCDDALCEADSVGATKGIAEALEYAYQKGAEDSIRATCTYCRAGDEPTKKGMHILEVIQGHIAREVFCPAQAIRALPLREEKDDAEA